MQKVITKCWKCDNKVFEFKDGLFGCDTCKKVWRWNGKGWEEVKDLKNEKK